MSDFVSEDFNALEVKEDIVNWIREWFEKNGNDCNAVIGMSGGKDSTIVAALCIKALGKDRVIGVRMPKAQSISSAKHVCEILGIDDRSAGVYIKTAVEALDSITSVALKDLTNHEFAPQYLTRISRQAKINMPARIRMTMLYAIAQTLNGRVANTCNLSEDYVGYSTRYGDGAGDFSPLSNLTVGEVKAVGRVVAEDLGLPEDLVIELKKYIEATPEDGLCGKTDEDNLGFTYETLDRYIRTGVVDQNNTIEFNKIHGSWTNQEILEKIEDLHEKNKFKLKYMDCYSNDNFGI